MRWILHIDMDAFFVSVEQVLDPSLVGKPVIVGGDPTGRGVVAAASYEARRFGIHSAMPLTRAKKLCPSAIFLRGSQGRYSEFSARVFSILNRHTPQVEPMSLDEAFLDLTGCERLLGPVPHAAMRIHDEIKSTVGINASIGIASNKLLAKIASGLSKPNGMLRILPGQERAFLASLPVRRIPGIGPKSGERFRRMGIQTVGQLAGLSRAALAEIHGTWGAQLYDRARGICHSPVLKRDETRSISRETTFEEDSSDPKFLESTLSYQVEKVTAQLRQDGLRARCVTLKLRNSKFKTVTRSRTLDRAVQEDHVILATVMNLFRHLFTTRTRVRLIGVGLSSLTAESAPTEQMELFQRRTDKPWDRLYCGIDRLRKKYGFRSILRASSRSARGEQKK